MIHCRNCINWRDESLRQIEAEPDGSHAFMGCSIFGFIAGNAVLESCAHYVASENLYTLCETCSRTVPRICVSLGECINCTDTDLFCAENCIGGDNRKYCTHFVRLHTQGVQLIENDQVYDLFPTLGLPGSSTNKKKK
jgi:hypothetical protein